MRASAMGGITPQGIFNDLSRSFHNGMLDIDLKSGKFNRPQGSGWFVDQDFIPRNSTSCSIVVQGVKPGEKAELTTMWTMLGYPPTGIAVPLWVKDADKFLPSMVCWDKACAAAPLSDWSLRLSNNVFCYNQGMGTNRYLNWENCTIWRITVICNSLFRWRRRCFAVHAHCWTVGDSKEALILKKCRNFIKMWKHLSERLIRL